MDVKGLGAAVIRVVDASRKPRLEILTSGLLVFQILAVMLYIFHVSTGSFEREAREDKEHTLVHLRQNSSCFFSKKLEKTGMPIVHSIFADPFRNQVVVTGVRFWFEKWHEVKFLCEFHNRDGSKWIQITDPMVEDYQRFGAKAQYVLVMTCPLPKSLQGVSRFTMSLKRSSNASLAYENVTVCQSEGVRTSLSMCTMLKNMDSSVPPWLDYHRHLGVQHVYIYDNSDTSTLRETVKSYVDSGFLTIIPWAHVHSFGKTYLEVQIAHENDCLWRQRHRTDWMIKIDVDEFLQPMDPDLPLITDVLSRYSDVMASLGSLRVQNWFFCSDSRKGNQAKGWNQQQSVFEKNLYRSRKPTPVNMGRDKALVRPINVHYFKIHGVKLGGETITLSPWTEMRMVHYRGDNRLHAGFKCSDSQPSKDTSMCRLWKRVQDRQNQSTLNGIICE